ncbi:hypothetical protein D9611_010138 [Ephemerocybe angulata]|uniref:Uncharacterized protein n=1 Tax=Ephemerocybe angulata TaxID=980116 RepID=A0A8H5EV59_9AGAR|nr:hypothetical protein D9611_010138 [Tulosesus angulatus]
MFAFPPPAEGNTMFDGCPIVQTYDSAQDMSFFLRAVLDSDSNTALPLAVHLRTGSGRASY